MKKTVILATAAALALGFAAQAEEQKAAPTAGNTTTPAATTTAAPVPTNTGAEVVKATKPAPTTTTTTVTETTKNYPAGKATVKTATETVEEKATVTTPTGAKAAIEATQTMVAFKVEGLNSTEEFYKLQTHLKKDLTKGVYSFNCNAAVKECTATINPTQTNVDAILSWAKSNKYNLMKK